MSFGMKWHNMPQMLYNIMKQHSPQTPGTFCGFSCPGSPDDTSLAGLLVSLLIWCFLECSKVSRVGMFKGS